MGRHPRESKHKRTKPSKPVTRQHRDAKDCSHPVGNRIGDYCALCGEKVKGR